MASSTSRRPSSASGRALTAACPPQLPCCPSRPHAMLCWQLPDRHAASGPRQGRLRHRGCQQAFCPSLQRRRPHCAVARSGLISSVELEAFLAVIAPPGVSAFDVRVLAARVLREADTNSSGLISYSEFLSWRGLPEVLSWIDAYQARKTKHFDGPPMAAAPVPMAAAPVPSEGGSAERWRMMCGLRMMNSMLKHSHEKRLLKGFQGWKVGIVGAAQSTARMMGVQMDRQKAELQALRLPACWPPF